MNKQISMAGLNIVTQPHSPERYLDLMRRLWSLKRSIRIRGTQCLMIGELARVNKARPLDGFFGRMYRFDQIDDDAPWFNIEDHSVATDDDMALVSIPNNLKPNLVMFDFVFFPNGHKLYLEAKSGKRALSPLTLQRFFLGLCNHPRIQEEFGKVEITVLPDREQLEAIFSMHRLAKLTIDIRRPNPDDFGEDEEDQVFRRFDGIGVRRMVQSLTAEPGESITPDNELSIIARVASKNGKVEGVGYSAIGDRIEESTIDRPWSHSFGYDSMTEAASTAFLNEAQNQHTEMMRNHG